MAGGVDDDGRVRPHEVPRRKADKSQRPLSDLPLFAERVAETAPEVEAAPSHDDTDKVIQFPGLRL